MTVARAEIEGETTATVELPTTTIERETLRDLLDLSVAPPAQQAHRAHTVPRGQVRRRDEPEADDDLDGQLSPLIVLGVLGLLLVVFIAVSQLH